MQISENLFKLPSTKSALIRPVITLILGLLLGIQFGTNIQQKISNQEKSDLISKYEQEVAKKDEFERELIATANDRAIVVSSSKEDYKKEIIGFYSPLIDGKQVQVTKYRYKGKTIIHKWVEISENSGLEIYEYPKPDFSTDDETEQFVTFG